MAVPSSKAGGQSIDLPVVSIYRLREGRIIESRMLHFDTVALLQFLESAGIDQAADSRSLGEKTS